MAIAGETARETARRIIDILPDHATWDDILYALYVRQKIERGLADADAGRTVSQKQLKDARRDDTDLKR